MRITINKKQRLYVIPYDYGMRKGYTCLDFDKAFEKGTAIVKWLFSRGVEIQFPKLESVGKIRGYHEYDATVAAAKRYYDKTRLKCPVELSSQLIGLEGKRIEVIDAYGEKRRFYVGKSTGWIPCHLEIARVDSSGGLAVTGTPFRLVRVIKIAYHLA